jgi:hypothetical protein
MEKPPYRSRQSSAAMKIPRTAFCLFCDDIRMEIGNKPSFMGAYIGTEIIFPPEMPADQPALLPRFAIAIWLLSDINDRPKRISVRIFAPPGRTEIFKFDAPMEALGQSAPQFDDAERVTIQLNVPLINLVLPCEGVLEVTIETEKEVLRAGRLRVRMPSRTETDSLQAQYADPASPQLSERSPPAVPASKPPRARRRMSEIHSTRTHEPD